MPAIANGEIQIVIGTHALIEETVVFSSLGLAIIDEQHRFGVEQRSRLWTKNVVVPHVLVMTATPIPRTLAMTLYGDLEYKVCMVHGRMKAADKETEMQKFVSGEAQILMATTVIEVGVNVPNASVMVIESAERFGLSQLHQLRGRVGRGAEQSYCVLVSSYKLSNETRKRLEIMVSSNNGFEIAEADLRLRGHGDLEGTRQSGEGIDLKIANLAADGQILQYARDIAQDVLNEDPDLLSEPNQILNERLKTLFAKKVNWGMIS